MALTPARYVSERHDNLNSPEIYKGIEIYWVYDDEMFAIQINGRVTESLASGTKIADLPFTPAIGIYGAILGLDNYRILAGSDGRLLVNQEVSVNQVFRVSVVGMVKR